MVSRLQDMGMGSLLSAKTEQDASEGLNTGPLYRGPMTPPPASMADLSVMKSWQFQATGKVGAAQVLQELKVAPIKHGKALHPAAWRAC